MKPALLVALLGLDLAGCSFILDFNDETNLPCACTNDYVCLRGSNRCVHKGSVDLFKSCSLDADNPDDLCPPNAICIDNKSRGPRCLPKCVPVNYSTADSAGKVAAECPNLTTCWDTGAMNRGGVCDDGECTDLPNDCAPPMACTIFNGAGVCFTPCLIFAADACAGPTLACHPVGASSATACLKAGTRKIHDMCDDQSPCAKTDAIGRPMVCDRPQGSDAPLRCLPICHPGDGHECTTDETCSVSRLRIDPVAGTDLGLCVPRS